MILTLQDVLIIGFLLAVLMLTHRWDLRIQARDREFDERMAQERRRGEWLLLLEWIDHGWTYPRPKEGRERRTRHDAGRG